MARDGAMGGLFGGGGTTSTVVSAAVRDEHARLVTDIDARDEAHHTEDAPLVDDATYDAGRQRLEAIEAAHPVLAAAASPSAQVGAPLSERFPSARHIAPMLSPANAFAEADVASFLDRARKELEFGVADAKPVNAEPKLNDLSLRYEGGVLMRDDVRHVAGLVSTRVGRSMLDDDDLRADV